MLKTIVWATDGSDSADRALPYATELASRDGTSLLVVHVVETPGRPAGAAEVKQATA
jgi:nucleotide-binding universal stress UspA family protein